MNIYNSTIKEFDQHIVSFMENIYKLYTLKRLSTCKEGLLRKKTMDTSISLQRIYIYIYIYQRKIYIRIHLHLLVFENG